MPVIVLSARVGEADKIAALDAGADDYLTKPFGVGELLARVRAALRRRNQRAGDPASVVRFGDVEVDPSSARRAPRRRRTCTSRPSSTACSSLLVANAGKVLTHRQILREVWGPSHVEHDHYVRVYMGAPAAEARGRSRRSRSTCLTETAVGYRLVA